MKEGRRYKLTFDSGDVTKVKVMEDRGFDYLLRYLEGETNRPITTLEHEAPDTFCIPKFIFERNNNKYEELREANIETILDDENT